MSKDTEDKLQDLATYGVSFSKGGKRIDPRDVYISTEPEQEPVAWMVETHFNNEPIKEFHTVKPMERVYKYCIVTELYAAPLKPLTGIEISNGFKADDEATHPYSYWAGVEFAEKHHGIGGGE